MSKKIIRILSFSIIYLVVFYLAKVDLHAASCSLDEGRYLICNYKYDSSSFKLILLNDEVDYEYADPDAITNPPTYNSECPNKLYFNIKDDVFIAFTNKKTDTYFEFINQSCQKYTYCKSYRPGGLKANNIDVYAYVPKSENVKIHYAIYNTQGKWMKFQKSTDVNKLFDNKILDNGCPADKFCYKITNESGFLGDVFAWKGDYIKDGGCVEPTTAGGSNGTGAPDEYGDIAPNSAFGELISGGEIDCEGQLGTVLEYLQIAFRIIKIAGALLLILLTVKDFALSVADPTQGYKTAFNNFKLRVIYCIVLFLLPSLISLILKLIGLSNGTCGIV